MSEELQEKITEQADTKLKGNYWAHYVGYAKIGNKWGVAISRTSGNFEAPDYNTDEEWLFNDAPRHLRIEAVEHIPAMFEALIKAGDEAVGKLKGRTAEA